MYGCLKRRYYTLASILIAGEDSWVPWTARRSNQSILNEISPEYSLEGLMLKLRYFGHLMWRADSLEKTLMLGKIKGRKRSGQQKMRWLNGITNSMDMSLSTRSWWWTGKWSLVCCSPWGSKESGHDWATELNSIYFLLLKAGAQ